MKIVFDELWASFSWRTISRDIFVLFFLDKKKFVCLFFKNEWDDSPKGLFAQIKKNESKCI